MSDNALFTSVIGSTIERFLSLKLALGRKFTVERNILRHLDSFLTSSGVDLTTQSYAHWCRTREHLYSGVRRNWMRVVRNFCLYRRRTDSTCFVPDASQFPPLHQPIQPYIFSKDEINNLLIAVNELKPGVHSPTRRENYRLAIVLLYTTGLRRGELLRLTVGDYDPNEQTLLVRETKFHKSRLLPLSRDGACEVEAYLRLCRTRHRLITVESPLLWNHRCSGKTYTGVGISTPLRGLFRTAKIRTASGRLPRVHDFRHTFAVHALLRWYQTCGNVQTKLPFLSTYMGHVSIVSTEYYLHFIEQIAAAASNRFAQRCGSLVTQAQLEEGGAL